MVLDVGHRDVNHLDVIQACQRGDEEAFRVLFETHKDRVYSIALRYAGDSAAAMDIAQDTFLKLLSSIGQFRREASFESWLYRLVVNSCLDYHRRRRRFLPLLDEALDIFRAPSENALHDRSVRSRRNGSSKWWRVCPKNKGSWWYCAIRRDSIMKRSRICWVAAEAPWRRA